MQHAACDGHTLLSLLRHIRSELVLGGGVGSGEMGRDNGPGGSQAEDEAFVKHAKPVMIEWELPGEIRGMMEKAQESFSELAQCLDAELIGLFSSLPLSLSSNFLLTFQKPHPIKQTNKNRLQGLWF